MVAGCEGDLRLERSLRRKPGRSDMSRRWESGGLEHVGTRDHARGPEDAPVTLLKYGDYECPYCGQLHPVLEELREKAGKQVLRLQALPARLGAPPCSPCRSSRGGSRLSGPLLGDARPPLRAPGRTQRRRPPTLRRRAWSRPAALRSRSYERSP